MTVTHYSHYGVTICYHVSVNKKPYGGEDSTGLKNETLARVPLPSLVEGVEER
nr:MAG TPA: hypothetical protein [Caudoviricetes sp.]DAL86500.1 MAG TPA: hypothetical protein [Caudoviricetes sp.]